MRPANTYRAARRNLYFGRLGAWDLGFHPYANLRQARRRRLAMLPTHTSPSPIRSPEGLSPAIQGLTR